MNCLVTYNCRTFSAASNRCALMMARGLAANGHDVDFAIGGAGEDFGKDHQGCGDYRFYSFSSNKGHGGSVFAHYKWLRSGIIQKKWNIIVFYSVGFQFVPLLPLARRRGIKTIYVQGDHYVPLPGMALKDKAKLFVINAIDHYMSSRVDLNALTGTALLYAHYKRRAPNIPIYNSYPPIDTEQFLRVDGSRFRKRYDLYDKEIIAYCGGIVSLEGMEVLIRAMRSVARKHEKAHLVIAGKNGVYDYNLPKQIDYRGLTQELGIADRVTFTGFLSPESVRELLTSANILVMPKLDHHRNRVAAPIKLTEYFAAGRPVVASTVGDIATRFVNNRHLCFCRPGDVEDLSVKISRLLESPAMAEDIGRYAQTYARKCFDYRSWGLQVLAALSKESL